MNCDECSHGFEEPVRDNWELISLIERYGTDIFMNMEVGMNGVIYNVNTTAIRNVLFSEGYEGQQYTELFNDMCLFINAGIERIYKNIEDKKK